MYRVASILIVVFWLTMTALLLRNEVKPGDSALREVPAGHVVKLLLHHHQRSELSIMGEKMRLGTLQIDPQGKREDGLKVIDFRGRLLISVPGGERQSVAWDGEVEMNKDLAIQRFRIGVTMHDTGKLRSEVTVLPGENVAHYTLSSEKGILERQDYSLDERGARDVMQQLNIDASMLPVGPMTQTKAPVIKAQQSSIQTHGERMDTYLVTVESNGQTWLEFHVDQLGHIVQASTLLGYTLVSGDFAP